MPSLNDVYNQIVAVNAGLSQIHADDLAETSAITQVNTSVHTLDNDVKSGFAATIKTLDIIAQIDIAAVQLLFHLTQQTDTMICALGQISENTCRILTQATIQTELQTKILDGVDTLRFIAASANAGAVLERERLEALRAQVEQCCPPKKPPPACTYEPCPAPPPIAMPKLPRVGDQLTG